MSRLSTFYCSLSTLSLLLLASITLAQKPDPVAPPNTAKLYDNFYIDKTEISNIQWLEFLTDIKHDSVYYRSMLPDSSLTASWLIITNNPLYWIGQGTANKYMRSPETRHFPVVGITYKQVTEFCKWRSKVATEQAAKENYQVPPGKVITFRFRLPTEEEWMFAAAANLDTAAYKYGFKEFESMSTLWNDPTGYWQTVSKTSNLSFSEFEFIFRQFQKHGREPFFNCLKDFYNYFHYGANQPISTLPPKKRKPNQLNGFGLYAMIGNVSEMTDAPGISKGGSWAQLIEECRISSRQYYSKPEGWLGFRCVCEVMITD